MTNQQKARLFLDYQKASDLRCNALLSILSMFTGLPPSECQRRIEELAK